jgi:enoyl-CoA hydratase/carnithine racemase
MGEAIIREDANGVATLFLNRPEKLNALNVELFTLLEGHVDQIARQTETVGLVIVRGAGRCFSAGNDLSAISAGVAPPRANFQGSIIEKLANLPQPVITAVHGHCYTGGLELALAGDLIFASENAKFGDTHARWSMAPVWGMSQRLPRRVGTYKAREMMFTCRTYSGREAEAMGLANFCVPDEAFDAELQALAETIAGNSWFSHRANKKLLVETDGMTLNQGLAHEVFRGQGRGPDMEERIARGFGSKAKA